MQFDCELKVSLQALVWILPHLNLQHLVISDAQTVHLKCSFNHKYKVPCQCKSSLQAFM